MTKQGEHDFLNKNGIINLASSSAVGHPLVHNQYLPLRSVAFASLPTTGLPPVAIAWCPDFQYGTPPTSWAGPIAWNGTAWVPLYAGSLPAATVAGQPLNFSQAGGGGATDWANPGAIGSNTKNTGAFTSVTGSRTLVTTTIANGATLDATHIGKSLLINGGTVNLPLDANWAIGDEIEFIVAGVNATTLQWTGNSISGAAGASAAQVVSGGIGNAVIIKKMAAGVAYIFSGEAINLASPGPIGSTTPNTAKFTSIVGSWAYDQTVLTNGTTLVRATHMGQAWSVNGGTITIPLDANWAIGDEFRLITTGTNQTTIQGNGATFDLGPLGTFTSVVIAGVKGQQSNFKKTGTNSVSCYFAYHYLAGLVDTAIASPATDDELVYNATTSKWANTPGIFSIRDKWKRAFISPGSASSLTTFHIVLTSTATVTNPNPSAGTAYSEADRFTLSCTATAGNVGTQRVVTQRLWRGNAAGKGGFRVLVPFGGFALQPGMRASITLSSETTAPTNIDPIAATSTSGSKVGVAINSNTGNWNVFSNLSGVAPTVTALNASFPVDTTTWYEMLIECDPNGSAIFYTITNKNTGVTTGKTSFGTNIPASTDRLHINYWVTNNATAAAAGIALGEIRMEYG